ncbi:hypothetical protein NGM37_45710, partial [Streptomyces sp. TRM76130]|nr:hypothetical protein [Streptomyces sp. TRM76130]
SPAKGTWDVALGDRTGLTRALCTARLERLARVAEEEPYCRPGPRQRPASRLPTLLDAPTSFKPGRRPLEPGSGSDGGHGPVGTWTRGEPTGPSVPRP